MELHNLKPANGSIKSSKELEEEKVQKKEALLPEDTKELSLDLDILKKVVLKEVSNHYKEEFQNLDSTT